VPPLWRRSRPNDSRTLVNPSSTPAGPTSSPLFQRPLTDAAANLIAERLRVLGHPLRVKLVDRLAAEATTVQELVDALGTTQQNISKHLRVLRRAGVVAGDKAGTRVRYRLGIAYHAVMRGCCSSRWSRCPGGDSRVSRHRHLEWSRKCHQTRGPAPRLGRGQLRSCVCENCEEASARLMPEIEARFAVFIAWAASAPSCTRSGTQGEQTHAGTAANDAPERAGESRKVRSSRSGRMA
jgi:DNA-binding transcriptional ArsR family regulator